MSAPSHRTGVAVDRDLAMKVAADRLDKEFDDIGRNTIKRYLDSAYDEVAADAHVETFVPLMAERFTRERLREMSEHH